MFNGMGDWNNNRFDEFFIPFLTDAFFANRKKELEEERKKERE